MKKAMFLAVLLVFAAWSQAYADDSFTFDNSSWGVSGDLVTTSNGDGSFTVIGGSVTGTGTIDTGEVFTLVPLSSSPPSTLQNPTASNGVNLTYDNQLYPTSSTFFSGNGLLFVDSNPTQAFGPLTGGPNAGTVPSPLYINIWGNGPDNYQLAAGGDNYDGWEGGYGNVGIATLTTPLTTSRAVPEPASFFIYGLGLASLAAYRMKFRKA